MTREVVLDANVIVAWLDEADVLAPRARELMDRLKAEGAELVLIDITVTEALSVLCRRAAQRHRSPPNLAAVISTIRSLVEHDAIRWLAHECERYMDNALGVIESTAGKLNFNDALLVILQREGAIDDLVSFDQGFDSVPGFRRRA